MVSLMEKIASFTVNHELLEPGVYVSRRDTYPNTSYEVTTFDIRMCAPNREPVIDTAALHALEHMGATYLRNNKTWASRVLYFGPMGCRTGFYLLLFGSYQTQDIIDLLCELFSSMATHEGAVPGALPKECGNWHDSDLPMAKWWAKRFLEQTLLHIDNAHMNYPA